MNTVKKGDKLEEAIYNLFKSDIDSDKFLAKKEYCKIFKSKGYYSRDREKDIIFDIAIEIYYPGQKTYSMLFLIECKNYKNRVPVDDVEEFYAKTQQISGANIKAVVASTNSFQDSAFKFSKSKGIGLLRYFSTENSEWVLARSPSSIGRNTKDTEQFSVSKALNQQEFMGKGYDFYYYSGLGYTNSTYQFFEQLLKYKLTDSELSSFKRIFTKELVSQPFVPYLDISLIENKSNDLLELIGCLDGFFKDGKNSEIVKQKYNLNLNLNVNLPAGVLGTVDFKIHTISIDNSQCETQQRTRFTLAHELGHFFLGHSEFMINEKCYDSHLTDDHKDINLKDLMRLEWQANQFASCFLLPKKTFLEAFFEQAKIRGISNRGFGALFVDSQHCNLTTFNLITYSLMKQFNVSKTVVTIRLKQLGIMRER